MAARVSVDEVKAILDDSQLTDVVISSFITGATAFVDNILGSSTLGASLLKEIERYIAAHLISITRERVAEKAGAGGAFIEYTGNYGEGLSSSSYGQTAMVLDSTGTLINLGGKVASTFAIPGYDR